MGCLVACSADRRVRAEGQGEATQGARDGARSREKNGKEGAGQQHNIYVCMYGMYVYAYVYMHMYMYINTYI